MAFLHTGLPSRSLMLLAGSRRPGQWRRSCARCRGQDSATG